MSINTIVRYPSVWFSILLVSLLSSTIIEFRYGAPKRQQDQADSNTNAVEKEKTSQEI